MRFQKIAQTCQSRSKLVERISVARVQPRTSKDVPEPNTAAVRIIHRITQSVGATGGVYKGQGRNQHELMTRAY